MLVAIDCLVFGYDVHEEKLKLLLFKRRINPFAGSWSLIGGFVKEEEDILDAARRVLRDFTGLDNVFLEQLTSYGKANRDPGGRVISISYYSLIKLDDIHFDKVREHGAKWLDITEMPDPILDHGDMIAQGLNRLKANARTAPLSFELLPEEFTLPQLLKLYQSIYQKDIDDRNFRKKMLATGLLIKLDKKDKTASKKGAFYYQFDKEEYHELVKRGYYFDLF